MSQLCFPAEFVVPVFYYIAGKAGLSTAVSLLRPHEKQPAQCSSAPAVTGDDEFDLFGEDTAEERAAQEAVVAAQKAKKTDEAGKKQKKPVINKSTLVIEIKPKDLSTNLDEVETHVRAISLDGVEWSAASKKVPIAFGLQKLQMGCIIIDDLVNTEDIVERIECIGLTPEEVERYMHSRDCGSSISGDEDEETPGMVQSANIVSFQKL